MKPSGSVFYQDEYDTIYKIDWETIGNVIDITSIIETPYVWGKSRSGYRKGLTLYRYGMISVQRQLIRPLNDGYEIVAEGSAAYEDYIQMNYNCGRVPSDIFKHHLNYVVADEIECRSILGTHWADPEEPEDVDCTWADVGLLGTDESPHLSAGYDVLVWLDVWPALVGA